MLPMHGVHIPARNTTGIMNYECSVEASTSLVAAFFDATGSRELDRYRKAASRTVWDVWLQVADSHSNLTQHGTHGTEA